MTFLLDWTDVDKTDNPQAYIDFLHSTRDPAVVYYLGNLEEQYKFLDLQADQHILDIGCGTGFDLHMIYKYYADHLHRPAYITGIDKSKALIDNAWAYLKQKLGYVPGLINLQVGDIYHLEHRQGGFDRILARTVFQHLQDPYRAFRELINASSRDGLIAIIDTDWSNISRVQPDPSKEDPLNFYLRSTGYSEIFDIAQRIALETEIRGHTASPYFMSTFKQNLENHKEVELVSWTPKDIDLGIGFKVVQVTAVLKVL